MVAAMPIPPRHTWLSYAHSPQLPWLSSLAGSPKGTGLCPLLLDGLQETFTSWVTHRAIPLKAPHQL